MGAHSSLCFGTGTFQKRRKSLKNFQSRNSKLIQRFQKLQKQQTIFLHLMQEQKSLAQKKIKLNSDHEARNYLSRFVFLKNSHKKIQSYYSHIKTVLETQDSKLSDQKQMSNPEIGGISQNQIHRIDRFLVQLNQNKKIAQDINNQNQQIYDQESTGRTIKYNDEQNALFEQLKHKIQIKKNLTPSLVYFDRVFLDKTEREKVFIRNSKFIVGFCRNNYHYELSQLCYSLYHTDKALIMEDFVKYDWTEVECLYLNGCSISNRDWELFVDNANLFTELKSIEIQDNLITDVSGEDLSKFPKLKDVTFCFENWNNPLSNKSKISLENFLQQNQQIAVQFY